LIRINLASASASGAGGFTEMAAASEGSEIQRQGITKLFIMLILPVAFYTYESFMLIPDLIARQNSKQNLLDSLKAQNETSRGALEEKKKFEEDQAKLRKQIGAIDGLSKDRLKEVKILDTIQRDIPEKVWLSELSLKDERVTIVGNANADADLTAFMDVLSRSIYIKEVNLVRSNEMQSSQSAGISKKFEISCLINREGLGNGGVQ